jgi:hypothetical protein
MANEAVKIVQGNITPRRMTCLSGTAIAKGALLKLTDPVTCALYDGVGGSSAVAGIASTEKSASDNSTSIGVETSGIFDILAGDVIVAGCLVTISGGNCVAVASQAHLMSGAVLGKALESSSVGEVVAIEVGRFI